VDECEWEGVVCNDNGQVVRIKWARRDWSGKIPAEVRHLYYLKELDLSDNDIRGPLPESLYAMGSLEKLFLYKNSIGGTISSRIGQLSKLTHWHLSHNDLTGTIPQQLKSSGEIRPLGTYV
jgi:Leucine Rich repeat